MQVVISAPPETFDVARYGWIAMIQHSELLTFTMNAQFVVEELCSTVATFTIYAKYMLTLSYTYV